MSGSAPPNGTPVGAPDRTAGADDPTLLDRELSWLSFNARVLQEAADPTVPLLERLFFCGVFASNLDEFFKVRVASLRELLRLGKKDARTLGYNPHRLLHDIHRTVLDQLRVVHPCAPRRFRPLSRRWASTWSMISACARAPPVPTGLLRQRGRPEYRGFVSRLRGTPVPGRRRGLSSDRGLASRQAGHQELVAVLRIREAPVSTAPPVDHLPGNGDGRETVMFLDDVIRYNLDCCVGSVRWAVRTP